MRFTFYKQLNAMDCGPACLVMVAKYYGRYYNPERLRDTAGFSKEGVTLLGISETAEKIGFRSRGVRINYSQLSGMVLPCILHWDQNHFVVLVNISGNKLKIADPASRITTYSKDEFLGHWVGKFEFSGRADDALGVVLILEPMPAFYEATGDIEQRLSWRLVLRYLAQSKYRIGQVFITLIITSFLQLLVPFLTQRIVDFGIDSRNIGFVVLLLAAQFMVSFSQTIVGFLRSRLLLRISNILNFQILSDFWIKLTRLPVSYFDRHHTGDTLQRINDHATIKEFLTGTALNTLFSTFNFVVYAIVLVVFNVRLFFVFIAGSIVYFGWVQFFLSIRRKINYQVFYLSAKENAATLQLIQGMQEIRLNNAATKKRWEWENIQAAVFKLNFKSLHYTQWQSAGATLINQMQNIILSFITAKLVIDGHLTLGSMLAVQYIFGQLSGPISQWVSFVQSAQDAKIGMERLNEIHQLSNEEKPGMVYINRLPADRSLLVKRLTFAYPGVGNEPVLNGIDLVIPQGKVTAIVGASGSGKTTLLKILLKVYEQFEGEILIGAEGGDRSGRDSDSWARGERIGRDWNGTAGARFKFIGHDYWRGICGSVMQDGYIFDDTIAGNIAVGPGEMDFARLVQSCDLANIQSFIESLPNGLATKLGSDGMGLSQGQKQRILIARAIYKNPEYLFFDEATNSLDAKNEKEIVENLAEFFDGRTVIVVAHRLSTVKNADKIVVLDKGRIVEEGTHDTLFSGKGKYYELVKNQLEL